jgi:SNF2 family DNA or RNA helicase
MDAAVLVLLLRLRQICSHPALIQEGEAALISPDEMDDSITPEIHDELSRARNLVGPEFVAKMKLKLKETALRRIEAEKASMDAEVEDEEVGMLCHYMKRADIVLPVSNLHGCFHRRRCDSMRPHFLPGVPGWAFPFDLRFSEN